jgi:DNA-binding NtrC family response regulator
MGLERKIELDDSTAKLLLAYSWPGNIRQLRNEMQRALLVCDDGSIIKPSHLSAAVSRQSNVIAEAKPEEAAAEGKTLKEMMDAYEAKLIVATLDDCGWNKSEAARRLDISRQAFLIKLAKLGVTK